MTNTRVVKFSETRFPVDTAAVEYRMRPVIKRIRARYGESHPYDPGYIDYVTKENTKVWS